MTCVVRRLTYVSSPTSVFYTHTQREFLPCPRTSPYGVMFFLHIFDMVTFFTDDQFILSRICPVSSNCEQFWRVRYLQSLK
jgi:hypothetical protein